ncbi:SH3 domain-containing protein [Fructilactobacillus carniphilus]|uniref:SH3 domain-containing protein n=1 Tax=Fructilactobacillus carniphilus TaxID=2940297 RepID=A0ABY5BUV1_9LACO|nr:SH3 domain-containing protein [Fructilactobacillus carniphilus]USS90276.1 SH3 domain-containing protein [Fructilactobacillus carniphilus]
MKKYAKAHNKMALATGETKTRAKLTKSKHGWLKIAMGLTFASTALFAVGKPTHADVQSSAPVAVATVPSSDNQKNTEQAPASDVKQTTTNEQTDSSATTNGQATTDQKQSVDAKQAPVTDQKDQADTKLNEQAAPQSENSKQVAKAAEQTTAKTDEVPATDDQAVDQKATEQKDSQAAQVATTPKEATDSKAEQVTRTADAVKTDAKEATTDNQDQAETKETNKADQATPAKLTTDATKQASDQVETKSDDQTQNVEQTHDARLVNLVVQTAAQNLSTANMTRESGSYTPSGEQNVRDNPSLNGNITGQLQAGDTINYDGKVQADGYTWLHYTNYESKDRWVAQLASATTSHSDFINSLSAGALETWKKYGVLPSISIAQAIVESAWGQAAPGNNLFGIKGSYNGQSVTVPTQEWINGHYVTIQDRFRAYPSFAESVQDHGYFLYSNSRYANLLGNRDYSQVAWMLQNDGYATSPTYASTLINVIQSNNLSRFDQNLDNPTTVPTNPDNNSTKVVAANGTWTFSSDVNLRNAPSLSGQIVGLGQTGQQIHYDGLADNNGYTWMRFKASNGAYQYAAQLGANADIPATNPSTDNNNNTGMNQESGSYTLSSAQNVRSDASLSAGVTGQLQAGDTIYYSGTREADGYKWLHYNNYAGQDRWVADLNSANQTPSQPAPTPTPEPNNNNQATNQERGSYTLSGPQNVRTDASLSAGVTGQLQAGDTIYYDGTREADGYKWLHYNNYAGQDRWVADLNSASQPAPTPAPAPSENNGNNNNQESGSYTLTGAQNVRTDASLSAGVTGQLQAGDTIYYNGTRQADGYKWLHYDNYAGQDRWVADLNGGSQPAAQPTTPTNNDNGATVKVDGIYTVRYEQNVRTDASLSAGVTGQLQAGDTIRYDAMKQANGYTWLHYVNFAGADRWIAQL